jgi:hypothetical protein
MEWFLVGVRMENNKAFTLTNGGKAFFFTVTIVSCHRITGTERTKRIFFIGRVEKDVAPPRLSSEELHDAVSEYGDIMFGLQLSKQKFPGFSLTHNWKKQSIF